jgi:hypothetical protein
MAEIILPPVEFEKIEAKPPLKVTETREEIIKSIEEDLDKVTNILSNIRLKLSRAV